MAQKVTNEKGFLVICMDKLEAAFICGFGVVDRKTKSPLIIDDDTNKIIEDDVYYIAVLNRCFSKDTYNKWYATATNYPEDKSFEQKHYDYYANLLNLN